jgi:hypothetical protein
VQDVRALRHRSRVSGEGAQDAETEFGRVKGEKSEDEWGRAGDAEVCCEEWVCDIGA